jgi:hypothetical protein
MNYQQEHTEDAPVAMAFADLQTSPTSTSTARVLDEDNTPSSGVKDKMIASGVTGAVLGFLFGGPIGSALFGFTAAYVSQKAGATGDAERALGDVGLTVRAKAIEVDEKHKVVDATTKAASQAWERAKKFDGENQVLESSRGFVVDSWLSFVKFVQERRLLEKGVDTAGKGYEYVADKLCRSSSLGDSGTNNNYQPQQATK